MQQVARYARNRELHIEVHHSYIKMHATYEIMNCALRLIIHATDSQTLAGYKKKVRSKFTVNFDRTWDERISGFSICSNIFHKYRQLRPHHFG